ncbi:hypothetical protein HPB48_008042 [Haemaphysalis longicornis]|uniref:Uncharacterized protein n=1 Tax=Haemaphysalis longicornis TaxID=44386 RepID=A0A9J6G1R6_HAELO|nr:hypothetical protein HPB48_008042 [Haemaphysalis longicornis]
MYSLNATVPEEDFPDTKGAVNACSAIIIVFVLSVALYKQYNHVNTVTPNLCATSACRTYGSDLLRPSLNTSVSPCDSLTRFVCDGWQRSQELSVREHTLKLFLDTYAGLARGALAGTDGHGVSEKVATVFLSCYELLRLGVDELREVKKALGEAGITWPIRSKNIDLSRTLLYASMKLGLDSVLCFARLEVSVGLDVLVQPGRLFDYVRRHYVAVTDGKKKRQYFNLLREKFAEVCAEDCVSFEDVSPLEDHVMSELISAFNHTDAQSTPVTSLLSDFIVDNDTSLTSLTSALRALDNNTKVIVQFLSKHKTYLESFLKLWSDNGTEAAHLFVSWCTVQVAALYVNEKLIVNYYQGSREAAYVHHGIFCLTRAFYFFRQSLFSGYNYQVLHGLNAVAVENFTLSVRTALSRRISRWQHFDENVTIVSNWNSLDVLFRLFRHEGVAGVGSDVPVAGEYFVDKWRHSSGTYLSPNDADALLFMTKLTFWIQRTVEPDVTLMPYALSFPLFDTALTPAINYGGLGTVVALGIAKLFLDAYKNAPRTQPHVAELERCMRDSSGSKVEDVAGAVAEAIAASAVFDAYNRSRSDVEEQGLEGIELTAPQLLFVSMCFAKCPGRGRPLPDSLCDLPLQHHILPSQLTLAFLHATSTTWREANIHLQIDQAQNTATISTPSVQIGEKLIGVTDIKIKDEKHSVEIYGLAPDD